MRGTVIYPGFFDPFTQGHLNIVERAQRVFEKVIVAVADDSPKSAMFNAKERVDMISQVFTKNSCIRVECFQGLLANYMRRKKGAVLLRGIRTVSDFEYEYQMALANKTLAPDVETFFMMTEGRYSYLSSTVIKEVARLGGDVSSMVPAEIARRIRDKYKKETSVRRA